MSNMFEIRHGQVIQTPSGMYDSPRAPRDMEDVLPEVASQKQLQQNDASWAKTYLQTFNGGVLLPEKDGRIDLYKVAEALFKIIGDFELRAGNTMRYGMTHPVPALMNDWLTAVTALSILKGEDDKPQEPQKTREERIHDMIFSYTKQ